MEIFVQTKRTKKGIRYRSAPYSPRRFLLLVGLILCFVAGCVNPQPKTANHSTVNAQESVVVYNGINELVNQDVDEPEWNLAAKGEFMKLSAQARSQAQTLRDRATHLRKIADFNVDPAVINLGLKFGEFFDFYASYLDEQGRIAEGLQAFNESYRGVLPLIEAFFRGATGDLFGKYREAKEDWKIIEGAIKANRTAGDDVVRQAAELGNLNAGVKLHLQKTYGVGK